MGGGDGVGVGGGGGGGVAGNGSRPQKTLALFGATGNTGRPFLPAVLRAGWAVRAFLRTPAKVDG